MATGTTADVIAAFLRGDELTSHGSAQSTVNGDGSANLVSYSTIVAKRLPDGRIAVSPYSYSVTTAKLLGRLLREYVGLWWPMGHGLPAVRRDGVPYTRDWVNHSTMLMRVNSQTQFAGVIPGGRGGNQVLPFPIVGAE